MDPTEIIALGIVAVAVVILAIYFLKKDGGGGCCGTNCLPGVKKKDKMKKQSFAFHDKCFDGSVDLIGEVIWINWNFVVAIIDKEKDFFEKCLSIFTKTKYIQHIKVSHLDNWQTIWEWDCVRYFFEKSNEIWCNKQALVIHDCSWITIHITNNKRK